MQPEPLPQSIYDRAISLRVKIVILAFSGGKDVGYLDVFFDELDATASNDESAERKSLRNDVESWAWQVYKYSGRGDGSDYGDDLYYHLGENTVTTEEWYSAISLQPAKKHLLQIAKESQTNSAGDAIADEKVGTSNNETQETACLPDLNNIVERINDTVTEVVQQEIMDLREDIQIQQQNMMNDMESEMQIPLDVEAMNNFFYQWKNG